MFVDFDDKDELFSPLRRPFDYDVTTVDGWRYAYLPRSGILYPVGEQAGSIVYTNATAGDRYGYSSVEFPGASGDGAVLTQSKLMSGDLGFSFLCVFVPAASSTKYTLGTFNGQTSRNTQCSMNASNGLDMDWEGTANSLSTGDLGLRGGNICVAGFSDTNGGTNFACANGRRGGSATTGGVQGNVTAAYIARASSTSNQRLNGGLLLWALGERVPDEHLVQLTAYPHRIFGDEPILIFPAAAGGGTITGAGNIASAEAFGSATVVPGVVTVTPTGIASAEAFGTAQINQTISGAGNIASAEAFGSSTVVPGVVAITGAGDIASAEAFGDAAVSAGGSFITGAGDIASAEAFGSATVLPGAVTIIGAGGIVSAEAFGSAALGLYLLGAGGIVSAEAFGSAAVQLGTLTITGAGNIASGEAFGDALIPGGASYILGAGNIASGEAFGPVPLIPQNYTPTARILEVEGGSRILEVPGGDRVLEVPA